MVWWCYQISWLDIYSPVVHMYQNNQTCISIRVVAFVSYRLYRPSPIKHLLSNSKLSKYEPKRQNKHNSSVRKHTKQKSDKYFHLKQMCKKFYSGQNLSLCFRIYKKNERYSYCIRATFNHVSFANRLTNEILILCISTPLKPFLLLVKSTNKKWQEPGS